jgi:hypothetical protein
MSDLKGHVGELHMTVQVTRKATGKTEEIELVGFVKQADLDAFVAASQKLKEQQNDR